MSDYAKFGKCSEKEKLLFDYWNSLHQHMREKGSHVEPLPLEKSLIKIKQGKHVHEMRRFLIEAKEFELMAAIRGSVAKATLVVRLSLHGQVRKREERYRLLEDQKSKINEEIGPEVKWRKPKGKPTLVRLLWKECNVRDTSNWNDFREWHCKYLEKFHDAFHERIKNLSGQ